MLSLRRMTCLTILLAGASPLACSSEGVGDDGDDGERLGAARSALVASDPVSAAVTQSCSTTAVRGLAIQLVEEIQCIRPNTFARIDGTPGLSLGAAVFPYLQTNAAKALVAARKSRNVTMSINSALRTLPQQYLLYRWYQTGRCGIGLAAPPGSSNHESAVAIDVQDNAGWRASLQANGFRWLGASDPVHYDFTGGGTVGLGGLSVRAFQRLWNRNNPTDRIAEDGAYGPATASRLAKSPVGGFLKGADCSKPDGGPDAGGDLPQLTLSDVPIVPDATEPATDDAANDAHEGEAIGPEPLRDHVTPSGGSCTMTARVHTNAPETAVLLGLAVACGLTLRRVSGAQRERARQGPAKSS